MHYEDTRILNWVTHVVGVLRRLVACVDRDHMREWPFVEREPNQGAPRNCFGAGACIATPSRDGVGDVMPKRWVHVSPPRDGVGNVVPK